MPNRHGEVVPASRYAPPHERSRAAGGSGGPGRRHRGQHTPALLGRARAPTTTCSSTTSWSATGRCPDDESVTLSGVVTQVIGPARRVHGSTSDVFLIADGVLPARDHRGGRGHRDAGSSPRSTSRRCPGAEARRAEDAERDHALFFDDMEHRVPIGLGRDGAPLYANLEFIDGTRGAHVNISGISGVATKTSYATFLLYSLFHSGVLGAEAVNTKALIFNVKGEDLLFLDQPNGKLDDDRPGAATGRSGSPPTRSPRSRSSRRPRKGDPNAGPDVATRTTGVSTYYWTIADFVEDELLPFVFADAEDERQQYTMVIHNVVRQAQGRRACRSATTGRGRSTASRCATYHELVELIVRPADRRRTRVSTGPVARSGSGTINAFVRRLLSSQRALGHLIRADVPLRAGRHDAHRRTSTQVTVVDIHNLADRAQRFVVGVTLQRDVRGEGGVRRAQAAAVRRARRAQQVRTPRGPEPDQGDPARRRRAGPQPRHHPHRRAADRERGGAAGHRELGDPRRRSARPGRGDAARVRLPPGRAPPAGHASPSRARCSSASPRSPCRSWSSSRSRRGPPARRGARRARRRGPAPAIAGCRSDAPTRSHGSRPGDSAHVRILHTSDWHVGKTIRGRPASTSTAAVLAEIVEVAPGRVGRSRARRGRPLRVRGAVRRGGADRAARRCSTCATPARRSWSIAGNHDNPGRFEAIRPLFGALGITVLGQVGAARCRRRDRAHRPPSGERARHRAAAVLLAAVRGARRRADEPGRRSRTSARTPSRCAASSARLTADFGGDAVNLVAAHAWSAAGRPAAASATRRPPSRTTGSTPACSPAPRSYVALGHLHLAQTAAGRRADLVLGIADPGRLRRGGRGQARRRGRGRARVARVDRADRRSRPGSSCARSRGRSPSSRPSPRPRTLDGTWLRVRVTEPGPGRARRRRACAAR